MSSSPPDFEWRANVWIIRKSGDIKWPPRSWNFNKGHGMRGQPISTAINDDDEKYFVQKYQWLRGTTMLLDSGFKLPAIWFRTQNHMNTRWSHFIKMKHWQLLRTLLLINSPVKCFKEAGSCKKLISSASLETGKSDRPPCSEWPITTESFKARAVDGYWPCGMGGSMSEVVPSPICMERQCVVV